MADPQPPSVMIQVRRFPHWARRSPLVAFAVVGVAGLLFWWSLGQGAEQRALLQLPEPDRAALYQHTIDDLRRVCDPSARSSGLDDYCREQADLVVMFPECSATCRALAKTHGGQPSR